MGVLERYFVQDWKAMLNANGGRLPKPDDSPEGIKQREDFNQSMSDLRSSFGVLSKDEQKQCQTYMNAAEERAKAVDDMHKSWEKAQAAKQDAGLSGMTIGGADTPAAQNAVINSMNGPSGAGPK